MEIGSMGQTAMAATILVAQQALVRQEVQLAVVKQSAETLAQLAQIIQSAGVGEQVDVYA